MKAQKFLRLTKIKEWYLPVDADDYKLMLGTLGIAATRFHQNMLPIIEHVCKKHGIKGRSVAFIEDILDPYLERIGSAWLKQEDRKATITHSSMLFETLHTRAYAEGKKSIDLLEMSLRRFFERWGYHPIFDYSESRGKCKLHVKYKFDSDKLPIIPLVEASAASPTIRLRIGFGRLTLIMKSKTVEVNYSIAAGTGWTSLHTHTCTYSQIGDVRPMMRAMIDIVNLAPGNDEEKND